MKSNSDRLSDSLIIIRSTIEELDRISIEQNRQRGLLYETYKNMKLVESDLIAVKALKRSEKK